jgi:hypothetical protein
MEVKTCSSCRINKPYTDFAKNKSAKDGFNNQCKLCNAIWRNENRGKIKLDNSINYQKNKERIIKQVVVYSRSARLYAKVLGVKHYGGKCQCLGCNESRFEFLTMEHINGKDKKTAWHKRGNNWVAAMRANWPKDITIMCMNCNFSRSRYGYCPHEKERMQ